MRRRTAAVIAAGCALLALRPLLMPGGPAARWTSAALFAALLLVGVLAAASGNLGRPVGYAQRAVVLAMGIGAFAAGRAVGDDPVGTIVPVIALVVLAAVAEEAFFRRLVYGALRPGGDAVAVVGSATLFAVVHVTVYGWWVLPLDLAAGLVLSWQRWASGTWTVPAATHVAANLMVFR